MTTFRIDDIGASTKQFEQYSKVRGGNFWFLKKIWPFKAWGPYSELTADEWKKIIALFSRYQIKPIISITACWVERNNTLTPFPQKFPAAAAILKQSLRQNKIIVANHGLTHCVVGKHLPLFNASNRYFHREFWPNLPQELHTAHIQKSQTILENFFESPITIFVPPGNVWSIKTVAALISTNIKQVISSRLPLDGSLSNIPPTIKLLNDNCGFFAFHDRELKLYGSTWLKQKIKENE